MGGAGGGGGDFAQKNLSSLLKIDDSKNPSDRKACSLPGGRGEGLVLTTGGVRHTGSLGVILISLCKRRRGAILLVVGVESALKGDARGVFQHQRSRSPSLIHEVRRTYDFTVKQTGKGRRGDILFLAEVC